MRLLVSLLLATSLASCARSVSPDAGTEAVLVRKPILFGSGGVVREPVKPGRKWVFITTQANYVDMRPQRQDLEFVDLMTADGVPLDFHAVITYQITDSVQLVSNFGNEFFVRNLEQPFRTAVRDAVKKRGMNEMAITVAAAEAVDAEATEHLVRIINETGVPVRLIDVSLGRANPPDAVKSQRIETAHQEQRINTEKQRKLAEDQRKSAEEARAAADSSYNAKMGLSPEQYLKLQEIQMLRETCARTGACTFLLGSGAVPLVSVK